MCHHKRKQNLDQKVNQNPKENCFHCSELDHLKKIVQYLASLKTQNTKIQYYVIYEILRIDNLTHSAWIPSPPHVSNSLQGFQEIRVDEG